LLAVRTGGSQAHAQQQATFFGKNWAEAHFTREARLFAYLQVFEGMNTVKTGRH